jgi:hypothetical protein
LLDFFVDLLKKLLLHSFGNFFMLELLLFLHFLKNDIFKLSLVIKLPLFTKLNKLVLLLSNGMFAHWAADRTPEPAPAIRQADML